MKLIKSYQMVIEPEQFLDIPFNSELLWLGLVNEKPTLFVLADGAYTTIRRKFLIYSQDKDVSPRINKTNYVGSFEFSAEVGRKRLFVFEE